MNQSALDTDLALSAEIIYPWPSTTLSVVVSELQVNASNNTGVVVWSEPYYNGVALPVGTKISLTPSMIASGATYLIYGQVGYTFQPFGINLPTGSVTLNDAELLTPRNASQITVNWGS